VLLAAPPLDVKEFAEIHGDPGVDAVGLVEGVGLALRGPVSAPELQQVAGVTERSCRRAADSVQVERGAQVHDHDGRGEDARTKGIE
jgi:hypothetical protein